MTSTSEIYGKNTSDRLSEEDDRVLGSPLKSRWSYSEAKAIDEILAYTYWREKGLETVIVRLFNTVGPRQTGSYGMVIPRFVTQASYSLPNYSSRIPISSALAPREASHSGQNGT